MARKEVVLELKAETGATKKDLKEVANGLEKVQDAAEETSQETKKLGNDFSEMGGQLDTVTGGAITKFKGLLGGVKNVTKGFRTLKGAILSTGIGALVIAIGSLTAAFTSSEAGQDRFQKILSQLGVIAGNVGDIFTSLGNVILETLSGNFDAAGDAFDLLKERVVNFGQETRKEFALAGDLADKTSKANKLERTLIVDRMKANIKINQLKTKAAEVDKFTNAERIKFLQEAAAEEDKITGREVNLAKLRRDIKIEQNTLSESTREDLEQEAQLTANVLQLEEQRILKNKELLGVAAGLRKMEADAKAAERATELAAIQKQSDDTNLIQAKGIEEQKIQVADLSLLKKKAAKEDVEVDKLTTGQKLDLASNAMGNLASMLGEESKAGKAAAIAQTTIETYKGATSAFASLAGIPIVGPVLGAIAAAAAVSAGIANVKRITSTGPAVSGGSSSAGSRGASVPSTPTPPAFNVVGAAPESQLAQTIGEKEDKPVKAFVVSNDVTTAQSLDRNIIESASI